MAQKTVAEMSSGQTAVIAGFDNPELANKLLEMGFLPGTVIRFNFIAPLGDPLCVTVGSIDLSIRVEEAKNIFVLE